MMIRRKLRAQVKPWHATRRTEIKRALTKSNGNVVLAAALLGLGQATIYRARDQYQVGG